MKFLKMVMVAGLLGATAMCWAEEKIQIPEPSKPIIKFKLMTGEQYPLCRDYVEMLNKAQYTEIPVCERTILPEFSKFKAVEWTEITDKEEIRKMMKEQIRLHDKWVVNGQIEGESEGKVYGVAGQPDYRKNAEERIQGVDKHIEAGEYPRMYKAHIDMDHDGEKDDVYQFIKPYPNGAKYSVCTEVNEYIVLYKSTQKTEEAYSKPFGGAKPGLVGGSSGTKVFYFDGRAYQDYWEGLNAQYQLKVNEISGIPNQVCGVNVVK